MVRLFNVYYPTRMLVLIGGEALIICISFVIGAMMRLGPDSLLVLQYQYGFYKILGLTALAMLGIDYFDLYDPTSAPPQGEIFFRLLVVLGLLSFLLAGVSYFFPNFVLGNNTFVVGLFILTFTLLGWRSGYAWLLRQPFLRERICILGSSDRASRLVSALRAAPELGMDVVGWQNESSDGPGGIRAIGNDLSSFIDSHRVDRVIVALSDRRSKMPVRELLALRLSGVKVEDATGLLEKISGKIEVEGLYPSWFIFSEGFRLNPTALLMRRIVSFLFSALGLVVSLPFLPLVAIAIKLTSPGPVFFRQRRVGKNGKLFVMYKFRTMRNGADPESKALWAGENDPRITTVGHWLRRFRLDEIPQLWNVLRGDMGFVGPRPEQPEFVEWLSKEIPYYHVRHFIRPGVTGWAQVCYRYGASLEESTEKLKYDIYYLKNMSVSLDLVIVLRSVKIILLGRGSR